MASAGTPVAGGKVVVPAGVAVEVLDGGKQKLSKECPAPLRLLLEKTGLQHVYDEMVEAIVQEGKTRGVFGGWNDAEFNSIIDLFREAFAEGKIQVALCKRESGLVQSARWLEFIDQNVAEDYVPQYDTANLSGQTIHTVYTTLEFPQGVAVEPLRQWNGRKHLRDTCPIYVKKLLEKKDLFAEYDELVQAFCKDANLTFWKGGWNIKTLLFIKEEFAPRFEAKGVSIFLSHKQERVSHGNHSHVEYFRWIEFVDREEQPNYSPQRDADTKKEDCVIM